MSTRSIFDQNLNELKAQLLKMAGKAEDAMKEAMISLLNQDVKRAREVILKDQEIDDLDFAINDKALLLIAKESPVAKDLRRINTALKVSSEIERMGDMAVNIAKSVVHIGNEQYFKELVDIPMMMEKALIMVSESFSSFFTEDVALAEKCAEKDEEVDQMFGSIIQELLQLIPNNTQFTNQIIQLSFICRFIERIADHSTNIAENVIYLVTGQRCRLNA